MIHSNETLEQIKKILVAVRTNREGEKYKRERWVTLEEAYILYSLLLTEDIQNYYESGTANGYSSSWATLAILQNDLVPNVHTWDPVNREKIWESYSVFKNFKKLINFHLEEFKKATKQNEFPSRSLYFIDGNHTRTGFKEDFRLVQRLAVKKDVIVIHDILGSYVYIKEIFDQVLTDKKHKIIPTDRGMGIIWM